MGLKIIGVDCATDPKKTGLALGAINGNKTVISEVTTGGTEKPVDIIHEWIRNHKQVLLALDAPLGWPADLGNTLTVHRAGDGMGTDANDLFRRETDRFVTQTLGKRPLDVGADRIARTAHSALTLLDELRDLTGSKIPLAWSPKLSENVEAVEVYPAGTLTALGLPSSGYKKRCDKKTRVRILEGIKELLDMSVAAEDALAGNADLLDAAICVLAGRDFLDWKVLPPGSLDLARQEGWIWVRPRDGF